MPVASEFGSDGRRVGRGAWPAALLTGGALGSIVAGLVGIKAMYASELYSFWVAHQWTLLADRIAAGFSSAVALGLVVGMAAGFGASQLRWIPRLPGVIRAPVIAAGLFFLCGAAAAWVQAGLRAVPSGPNIVLVVIDTTRPDHLSVYGYERETTPQLNRLASTSTVFTRAYSTSSWTAPAHASIFTGLYPDSHGVTQESFQMRPEHVTLAEVFWEQGYRTVGIVSNPVVSPESRFNQGFEEFHQIDPDKDVTSLLEHGVVQRFLALVDSPAERPFFAFVNLIEPHNPYTRGPHLDRFETQPQLDVNHNHLEEYLRGNIQFGEAELARLRDLYDGEIFFADEIVGEFVDALERRGILDDTIFVVTSDHGEHFGEHGLLDHVFNLYEGNVRVPLMIRYPRVFEAGERNDAPVQIHDLFPTLIRLSGNKGALKSLTVQGLDISDPDSLDPMRPLLMSYGFPYQVLRAFGEDLGGPKLAPYRRRLWGMREGNMKIIVGGDGSIEVYDLAADPQELRNLSTDSAQVERVEYLDARIRSLARVENLDVPSAPEVEMGDGLDEDTKRQLRSLGYLAPE